MQIKLPQYRFEAVGFDGDMDTLQSAPNLVVMSYELINETSITQKWSSIDLANTKIALMFLKDEIHNVNFKNNWVQGYLLKNMSTAEWVFSILNLLNGSSYIHSALSRQLLNKYRNS